MFLIMNIKMLDGGTGAQGDGCLSPTKKIKNKNARFQQTFRLHAAPPSPTFSGCSPSPLTCRRVPSASSRFLKILRCRCLCASRRRFGFTRSFAFPHSFLTAARFSWIIPVSDPGLRPSLLPVSPFESDQLAYGLSEPDKKIVACSPRSVNRFFIF